MWSLLPVYIPNFLPLSALVGMKSSAKNYMQLNQSEKMEMRWMVIDGERSFDEEVIVIWSEVHDSSCVGYIKGVVVFCVHSTWCWSYWLWLCFCKDNFGNQEAQVIFLILSESSIKIEDVNVLGKVMIVMREGQHGGFYNYVIIAWSKNVKKIIRPYNNEKIQTRNIKLKYFVIT